MLRVQRLLLRLGRVRFGEPGPTREAAVLIIEDVNRLEFMCECILTATSWDEVLNSTYLPPKPPVPKPLFSGTAHADHK